MTFLILMGSQQPGVNPLVNFLPIIAIFAIIYFLLIRPQRLEQRKHGEMIKSLRKGDEIVTAGGIYGKVVSLSEEKVTIRVGDSTKMDVERSKVARLRSSTTEKRSGKEK